MGMKGTFSILPQIALEPISEDLESKKILGGMPPDPPRWSTPYTLLLLFGQWLQAISHLKLFSWVNSARLKPFMDAYHAPYKAKHHYWPGLLLVFRFVLLLVFALNPQQHSSVNLLVILTGDIGVTPLGTLQLWTWVSGGVYRNWCLDALEGSFALNLTILAAATYYMLINQKEINS